MGLSAKRRDYKRHSDKVTRTARWKALRMQALDRDGWQCIRCGAQRRLEVDHIEPVRARPDLSFYLSNLQVLCCACHSRKTRIEVGHPELSPARKAWRDLVAHKMTPLPEE
jgi:5-methylcytosine-specific restriction protein A